MSRTDAFQRPYARRHLHLECARRFPNTRNSAWHVTDVRHPPRQSSHRDQTAGPRAHASPSYNLSQYGCGMLLLLLRRVGAAAHQATLSESGATAGFQLASIGFVWLRHRISKTSPVAPPSWHPGQARGHRKVRHASSLYQACLTGIGHLYWTSVRWHPLQRDWLLQSWMRPPLANEGDGGKGSCSTEKQAEG